MSAGPLQETEQLAEIESGVAELVPRADLIKKLKRGTPLRVKLGVDPTAPDLHLGHAVPLRKLRQFQDLGHTVVLIIGDYTALIGDPSGRNSTRPPLSKEQILENAQTYIDQASKILDIDSIELRYNSEWLGQIDFEKILELTSRLTVARILERDDFSKRYKEQQPISLHEFLYPVMQAYDSIVIESDLELGGTDQLFNLLTGRELMEKCGIEPQVCLTLPLLEGIDGVQKMSKSYGNYVGLTDEPADMFGKIMSIPDELMAKYYRLATLLPASEVDGIESALADGSAHPNHVKRRLAREIVSIYHGEAASHDAESAFDRVYIQHGLPDDIPEKAMNLENEPYLPGILLEAGLVSSTGEGRRMIDGGGVRIDSHPVSPKTYAVDKAMIEGKVLQVGKRRYARIISL